MKNILLLFTITLVCYMVSAQGWRPGEMEVKVRMDSKTEAMQLYDLKLNGDFYLDYAILYVTPEELQNLKAAGFEAEIRIADLNAHYKDFWQSKDAYHTYQEIIDLADSLVTHFPDICQKHIFGSSMGGRQLAALKISDNAAVDENEAEVMFDGGIHGDEIGGPENLIRFARDLCLDYGTDPDITDLIDNREIWLYLMVNPDGRVNMSRYNNNGVDLNRDWGYMWDAWGSSPGAYSQIESKSLRACSFSNQFVVHTTYHSGTEYISCPWSYRASTPPDMDHILQLAGVYADVSGYSNIEYGQGNSGMYAINGSTKDSNYGVMGSISWSMEISYSKQPPASQIMTYYNYNVPAMLAMIEYSGYGLEGTVTDANTGEPVAAVIFVDDFLPTFCDPEVGDYHKYVLAGTYNIMVKANGYADKLVTGVTVSAMSSTVTDITLDALDHQSVYRFVASQIEDNNPSDEGHTWKVIGQPDNAYYSIGKDGWAVLDMQEIIFDGAGPDLMVFEGDASAEGYTFYAGETMDGPWHSMGTGSGTAEFDFSNCNISEARYFKIQDDGDGSGSVNDAGFDLDAIQALSSVTGPYIIMEGYVIDDSNGNNNGQLDPGETADFIITLKNVGSEQALNITGDLSTSDPYVSVITTAAQNFGNIAVDGTASGTFTVSAEASAPAGHTSTLEFQYEGDNVAPNTKYIDVHFPDYCYPSANCSYGDGLDGFALNQIQNLNNGCSINGYGDYTSMKTYIQESNTVTLVSAYYDQYVSLWIDFDDDKHFEDEERLITDYYLNGGYSTVNLDVSLPPNTFSGVERRLRVRSRWNASAADPCESFSYGETEDYTVEILTWMLIPPQNFSATILGNDVQLSWEPAELPVALAYNVYRDGQPIAVNITDTCYLDENLPVGEYGYYIKAIYELGLSSPTSTIYVEIENPEPVHFVPVWSVPNKIMEIYVRQAWIDNIPMDWGDEIAVFDIDPASGTEICVGVSAIGTPLGNADSLLVIASMNDGLNPEQANGFIPGHEILYRFWNSEFGEITAVSAVYPWPGYDEVFTAQGTAIVDLTASAVPAQQQVIALNQGWMGISAYLLPQQTNMQSLMAQLPDLEIIQNPTAFYQPGNNASTLSEWEVASGYFIKNAVAADLIIEGFEPESTTLQLTAGQHLLPVLSAEPVMIETLFAGQLEKIVIIRDAIGMKIYWPAKGINTLQQLEPGKAYLIQLNEAVTVTY